jgi:predicted phage-related endonuclease
MELKQLQAMRPDLEIIDVSQWSHEKWLAYRSEGLGCSDLGTALGHNPWQEPAILFAQKVGIIPTGTQDNQIMFMGRVLEPVIADLWEHYDIDEPGWEECNLNLQAGIKKREMFKPEVYVKNPKYPYLMGGPDGLFMRDGKLCVLEIKTISKYSADQYVSGIPTSYIFQIHGYMMLFDADYAEIAMLQDGRELTVVPFERDERVVQIIEEHCSKFWDDILEARELYLEQKDFTHLEPEPTSSEVYEQFLLDRFKAHSGLEKDISKSCQYHVNKFISFRNQEKKIVERKRFYSNKIKYYMGEATELLGVPNANVTWRPTASGSRRFNVREK